ncbi:MAG: YqgE/AlgH family protein [Alphaproteobacteria bacterium]|nr:YqgE/AlgH family protein [Alphaproteobacteria bacterium]MBU1515361.1 YqgE/AlgH family protein [Alphaproteobacteria bacterium]MBU2095411.1 YqgE/AlgH family protein [Alphaproteobacteria bacterium]MBU2152569.1 YqgE/AlgH family protein [Alphaproteobacteria bacterium]MBU2309965.1 YqgE/AlgH family protein [Alphaproteobacteria bacterium]
MEGAFLSGQMLIAMPGIGDSRFERSLILICAHDNDHAMGIAVNRPVEGLTVSDLLERLEVRTTAEMEDELVLMGGPVEVERGFVVHTDDYHAEHSLAVLGGLALTTTREVLEAMGRQETSPRRAILTLGYAGWGAGQLEREIRQNVWLTVAADEALVFDDGYATKWSRALGKLGIDPKFLSAEAGQA